MTNARYPVIFATEVEDVAGDVTNKVRDLSLGVAGYPIGEAGRDLVRYTSSDARFSVFRNNAEEQMRLPIISI